MAPPGQLRDQGPGPHFTTAATAAPGRLADALMASTSPAMLSSSRRARRTSSSNHLRDQRRGDEAQAVGKLARRSGRPRISPSSPLKTPSQRHTTTTTSSNAAPVPTPTPSHPPSSSSPSPHSAEANNHPVLSFWGPEPVPLPARFARIKRNLIAGHEAEVEASWARLLVALRTQVEQIECLGAHLIPSIEFADLDSAQQAARFGRDLRRYGVGVVRKVVPRADVEASVHDTLRYVDAQRRRGEARGGASGHAYSAADAAGNIIDSAGVPAPKHDPACFNLFWTPAQVRARAHPNVRRAQRFMMGLWETRPDDKLATNLPISYADRIRVYGSAATDGTSSQATAGKSGGIVPPQQTTESPDDWINALQSSAGIIAQVDNGSLERWEPDGYQRAGTYSRIFQGRWEEYDPWVSRCRASATTDLYNGYGACTIFRMFQGVLALSTVEPGTIRLLPSPKLATAYYLLRPFFTPVSAAAPQWPSLSHAGRSPEWDAYLAPDNWRLTRGGGDGDTVIHGAVPGHAQRVTESWHPHLHLRSSMITLPTLQPGDYILWHPDLPYHLSSGDGSVAGSVPGLTPDTAPPDVKMLLYVPAAPLTQTSALYLARQRKAFAKGQPGPDFDSSGRSNLSENPDIRPGEDEIEKVGGKEALRGMGLAPWEECGEESDVVRVANEILFPELTRD
ncbi:hypothetical protein K4F52_007677 [Lecanicillium sp. MT-2017a]|nr:hypothetical protein K4F52_007677 [Lecanicillium sp. MT-2017a]